MSVISTIKQKVDEGLISYVFAILDYQLDAISDEDILHLLRANEGATNLMRYLYIELGEGQRETIASAFILVIEQIGPYRDRLTSRSQSVLQLIDPYIRYSSRKFDARDALMTLARSLDQRAPDYLVVSVHVALLDLHLDAFETTYWHQLSSDRGQPVAAVVFSGLSMIDITGTFDWLSRQYISKEFADLLIVHLPDLFRRAPEETSRRLSALLMTGAWDPAARDAVKQYCYEEKIKIHTRIRVNINVPEFAPTIARILEETEEEQDSFLSESHFGLRLAQREVQVGNGLDATRQALAEYVAATAAQSGDFLPATRVLRARSEHHRRVIVVDPQKERDQCLPLFKTFLVEVDSHRLTPKLVARWEAMRRRITKLAFVHSEYHEERVLWRFFARLMELSNGPEISLVQRDWGHQNGNMGRNPIVRVIPKVRTFKQARSDQSIMYGFHGYHVFARQSWLLREIEKVHVAPQMDAQGRGRVRSDVWLRAKLAELPLEAKAWLAVQGGALHSGAAHLELGEILVRSANSYRPGAIPPTASLRERQSGQLFAEFLGQGNDSRNCLVAGAIHSQLILDWFLSYKYGFEILLTPDDMAKLLRVGESESGFFAAIEFANTKGHEWEHNLRTLLRKIAAYIVDLNELDAAEREGRILSQEDRYLVQAWRVFVMSNLGAEEDLPPADNRYWAFAADARAGTRLFRNFDDFQLD